MKWQIPRQLHSSHRKRNMLSLITFSVANPHKSNQRRATRIDNTLQVIFLHYPLSMMDECMIDEGNKLCASASTQNTRWNVNDLIKKNREKPIELSCIHCIETHLHPPVRNSVNMPKYRSSFILNSDADEIRFEPANLSQINLWTLLSSTSES